MKKIIIKLILFIGIFAILLTGIDVLSMVSPVNRYIAKITNSSTNRDGSEEIELRLGWVRERDTSQYLIVGDSVGNQLFSGLRGKNDDYCIAVSNQAITTAGQYILISEYIKNHEHVESIYMFIIPQTLGSDINPRLSYQYMVMPFIKNGYRDYLDDKTEEKLRETFGAFFLHPQVIKAIDYSCINRKLYLNLLNANNEQEVEKAEISDITADYLYKINDLCKEQGIDFYLLPAPVEDTLDSRQQIENFERGFRERGLDKIFPEYFEKIQYYPEKEFGDHVHFGGIYIEQSVLNEKIENIIKTDEELHILRGLYEE